MKQFVNKVAAIWQRVVTNIAAFLCHPVAAVKTVMPTRRDVIRGAIVAVVVVVATFASAPFLNKEAPGPLGGLNWQIEQQLGFVTVANQRVGGGQKILTPFGWVKVRG